MLRDEKVRTQFAQVMDLPPPDNSQATALDPIRAVVHKICFSMDPAILPEALECGLASEMRIMMSSRTSALAVLGLLGVQGVVDIPHAVQKLRDAGIVPQGIAELLVPGQDWAVVENAAMALKAVCLAEPTCIEDFKRENVPHMLVMGMSSEVPSREVYLAMQAALDCLSKKPVGKPAGAGSKPTTGGEMTVAEPSQRSTGMGADASPVDTVRHPLWPAPSFP